MEVLDKAGVFVRCEEMCARGVVISKRERDRLVTPMSTAPRVRILDELDAIIHAEGRVSDRVHWASKVEEPIASRWPDKNLWGGACLVSRGPDAAAVLRAARGEQASGKRVAVVADARALLGARDEIEALVAGRVGIVIHALGRLGEAGREALALSDLGVGVLLSAGPEDAHDLTLLARRAAEDSGTPIVVVHEVSRDRSVETVHVASDEGIADYVGAPAARAKPPAESARSLASVARLKHEDRIPFALGSAMRDLEPHTGRRHDVVERVARDDAEIVLFGAGASGDAALAVAEQLRDAGASVAGVRLTALRPYPGPRVVKALSRALAVCVLEFVHEPLAQSGPLATELKASFADAMTWATGYPGVGRLPRIVSCAPEEGELEAAHVALALATILEQGERVVRNLAFVPGAVAATHPRATTRVTARLLVASGSVAQACAPLVCDVVARATGLRVAASPRSVGDDAVLDVVVATERPRAGITPLTLDAVIAQAPALFERTAPLVGLAATGLVHVTATGPLPPSAALLCDDRGAKITRVALPSATGEEATRLFAAAASGVACAAAARIARAPIDPADVAKVASEILGAAAGPVARAAMG